MFEVEVNGLYSDDQDNPHLKHGINYPVGSTDLILLDIETTGGTDNLKNSFEQEKIVQRVPLR